MRYILSLLIAIALFCPVEADAGLVRNNFMPTTGGTFTGSVTITGGDLTIKAASGAAGTHTICSDAAEDNNDCWKIEVAIDGGVMTLESNASGSYVAKVTLTTDGDVTATGTGTFDKIATAASADPLLQMTDSDAGDGDVGYELDVDATATGSGAEDYDWNERVQVAGELVSVSRVDADGIAVTTPLYQAYTEVTLLVSDDYDTVIAAGDGQGYFPIAKSIGGGTAMDLVYCQATNIGVSTGTGVQTTDVMIHNLTQAADMLSVALTIDEDEFSSVTAATGFTIDTGNDDVALGDIIRIDVDGVTGGADGVGLMVTLGFGWRTAP